MGTSQGYNMPTGGDWTPLKHEATRFIAQRGQSAVAPETLLRDYITASGGARALARGGGGGGGGGGSSRGGGRNGAGHGGRAARITGRNYGGFLSTVGRAGLDEALREIGLEHLIGRPAQEVATSLLDTLAAPGSTLDDHAARLALAKLNDELFDGTQTYEDVERVLSQALDEQGLFYILARFFGYYIYERFCRDFYETWVKKVGSLQAARSLKTIKDCIESSVRAKLRGREVARIDWHGREGLQLTERVMQETLEIFEVTT